MKKQSLANTTKVFCTSLFAMLLMGTSATFAQANSAAKAEVTYLGANDEFLQFNVNYKNEGSEKFIFEIYDDQHQVIYSKKYNNADFNKKIYVYKLADYNKVTFSIRSTNSDYKETFTINPKFTTTEDYVVTKL